MNKYKDFVDTYNTISIAIEGLIENKDLYHDTNRCHVVSYLMEQLAKNGLLLDTINDINFEKVSWNISHVCGERMKSFDGKLATWIPDSEI